MVIVSKSNCRGGGGGGGENSPSYVHYNRWLGSDGHASCFIMLCGFICT